MTTARNQATFLSRKQGSFNRTSTAKSCSISPHSMSLSTHQVSRCTHPTTTFQIQPYPKGFIKELPGSHLSSYSKCRHSVCPLDYRVSTLQTALSWPIHPQVVNLNLPKLWSSTFLFGKCHRFLPSLRTGLYTDSSEFRLQSVIFSDFP